MANMSTGRPIESEESMSLCREILLLWTVGFSGQCHPKEFGGLIGVGGYTGIWMEVRKVLVLPL